VLSLIRGFGDLKRVLLRKHFQVFEQGLGMHGNLVRLRFLCAKKFTVSCYPKTPKKSGQKNQDLPLDD
jgi:hypothetical protein